MKVRAGAFILLLALLASAAAEAARPRELLIVAPASFHPALRDFMAFKKKLLPVEFKSLESILAAGRGVDDPEKLKRFLYDQWRSHNLGYALLVGGVDVMPVRYMVLDRVTPAAFNYSFYPSDLYYSALARPDGSFDDWNARKESFHALYFGEVRGEANKNDPINYDQVTYHPDIAVGRWPVSTAEQAHNIAAKTIVTERAVLSDVNPAVRRAGFLAVGGWVDARSFEDDMAARLSAGWSVEKRYYSDASRKSDLPPDHQQAQWLFNRGAGLILHTGHGDSDVWEQCFSTADLRALTNSGLFPVVISAGCSTAHFATLPPYEPYRDIYGKMHKGTDDREVFTAPPPPPSPYQRVHLYPSCLGEALLRSASNGAAAYIGCDTGSQPCGLTLVDGFIAALAESTEPRLGDCWAGAVKYYYQQEHLATIKPTADWYPPSIFFQPMKFMLFGDPSLRLPSNQRLHAQHLGKRDSIADDKFSMTNCQSTLWNSLAFRNGSG
jgi:hypothetical protein